MCLHDAWLDAWVDACLDVECISGRMGCRHGWMHVCRCRIHVWMDRWVVACMDACVGGCMGDGGGW